MASYELVRGTVYLSCQHMQQAQPHNGGNQDHRQAVQAFLIEDSSEYQVSGEVEKHKQDVDNSRKPCVEFFFFHSQPARHGFLVQVKGLCSWTEEATKLYPK